MRCDDVEAQIPAWLERITVSPDLVPDIRSVYRSHIQQLNGPSYEERRTAIEERIIRIREEEADFARLLVTGRLSEESYDKLRKEWQDKLFKAKEDLTVCQGDASRYLDDLDTALLLLSQTQTLYQRLDRRKQAALLRILAKRIIVNTRGELIDHELHPPFAYLGTLSSGNGPSGPKQRGSTQFPIFPPE